MDAHNVTDVNELLELLGEDYRVRPLFEGSVTELFNTYGAPVIGSTRMVFSQVHFRRLRLQGPAEQEGSHRLLEGGGTLPQTGQTAPCEFVCFGGAPVLRMERVEVDELTPASDLPEWASSLDHGRVGHLPNGDVVAFTL